LKKYLIRRIHNFTSDPTPKYIRDFRFDLTLILPYEKGEHKRNSTLLSFYNPYKSPCNRGIMGI